MLEFYISLPTEILIAIMACLSVTIAKADIPIDEAYFPDENFRNLISQYYGNDDGVITDEVIAGISLIDVSYQQITSLKGIEFFTALENLYCIGNQLTSLDVSKNTALKYCQAEKTI